jgi:hypothetical protein
MSRTTRLDQKDAQRRRMAVKLYRTGTSATEVARRLHRSRSWVYQCSNNSPPPLIVASTPTGCMIPWSKYGCIFQVYMKFLH